MKIGIKEIICSQGSFKIRLLKFFDFLIGAPIAFLIGVFKMSKRLILKEYPRFLIIRPGGIGGTLLVKA